MTRFCDDINVFEMSCNIIIIVPAVLNEAVPATMKSIDNEIDYTLQTVNKYIGKY